MTISACASASCIGLPVLGLTARPCSGRKSVTVVSKFRLPRSSAVAAHSSRVLYKNGSTQCVGKSLGFVGSSITETRVRDSKLEMFGSGSCGGGAMGSVCALPASVETLRWIFVAAATSLLFLKNAAIPKHFLVPLLVLELPREALSWMRGEYGLWTAFVAILVKLFYQIPGEVHLPLYVLILVITAPIQLTQYRGSTPASLASIALAVYLAVEHYRSTGGVNEAFKSNKLLPTLAILALVVIPILFFAQGVYY
ncbi:hypothetical protein MPTK1_3g24880 [Marchantia polymorpha subsp. ruderalis]|uniref:Uncharacterized protein n=2 Tax=Marchantia polymorpha TaxID=3197 RepID=A0AAF6B4H5_MARPO|nr:hypothetical protein MARPO_0183s0020 [Marchantia polymorpha]BBN06909.1 hypothetical protein Mp_3g24880 [Marchantia polymorpha subsp. ruderalis]|eukprot:PTQ27815.1 hypothetical protein MARPO_0183s0020 [Marchantia polymorpha]